MADAVGDFSQEVRTLAALVTRAREEHEHQLEVDARDLANLQKTVTLSVSAQEVLRSTARKFFTDSKAEIEDVLSQTLTRIFADDYRIVLEVSETSKRAKLMVFKTGFEEPVPTKDGTGAGVLAVASFVLRVYFIVKFNLLPLLVMDEKLVEVANQYVPVVGEFIQYLCRTYGLDIFLITHVPDLAAYADRHYVVEASDVPGRARLRRVV
jgi:DNA repair ATPase RecN